MRVDDEPGGSEVGAGLVAEPADDGHPAIVPLVIDEDLAAEVVIEVDLVPGFGQAAEAFLGGLDPGRPGASAGRPRRDRGRRRGKGRASKGGRPAGGRGLDPIPSTGRGRGVANEKVPAVAPPGPG